MRVNVLSLAVIAVVLGTPVGAGAQDLKVLVVGCSSDGADIVFDVLSNQNVLPIEASSTAPPTAAPHGWRTCLSQISACSLSTPSTPRPCGPWAASVLSSRHRTAAGSEPSEVANR